MIHKIQKSLLLVLLLALGVVLTACGNQKEYTITFDTQVNTIEPIVALGGEAIYAPEDPVREGYRFDGWFDEDNEAYTFGTMPFENIEVSAKWSAYFQIHFNTGEGTSLESIDVVEGDIIIIEELPQRPHYKFSGWSYEGEMFTDETMPSQDITLEATWTEASTIYFDAIVYDRYLEEDIEVEVEPLVEVAGETITMPNEPTYQEYKFISWQLDGEDYDFTTMPDEDITLTASWEQLSNLPALFIDLFDEQDNVIPLQNVNREVYVKSSISLENTTSEFTIETTDALFKGRGNGSWVDSGDKRGYRIKFDDKQSVFGATSSRHWVILAGANFDDVTMWRNKLAFNMANEVFTNIEYATTAHWVDVYINGEYRGVYIIAEHLRVDEDRVDIVSEFGVEDTGYLIEYDAYASGTKGVDYFRVDGLQYAFSMKSPKPDDYPESGITLEQYKAQVAFIQDMTQNMVTAALNNDLDTFAQYADVDSFVDMYILHELFKNIDTGYSSFFLYREPGGKLFAGPPWDFDATLGSTPVRGNGSPMGIFVGLSVQAFSPRTASELLIKLYATPAFKDAVIARWTTLSPIIQSYVDQTFTDEMVEEYRFAMGRNFVKWPTPQGFGTPVDQDTAESNWEANIAILKQWLIDRRIWLDGEWSTTE